MWLVIAGCGPAPRNVEKLPAPAAFPTGDAALYGRVVVHKPSPLSSEGVEVMGVPGVQIMLFRPSFSGVIPPAKYQCDFERFFVGERMSDYLLRTGWVVLTRDGTVHRGRLIAAIPQPPPLTDYTGRFVLTGLAPGRYTLEIAAPHERHRFIEFSLPDSSVTRTFVTEETFLDLLPEYEVEP